MSSQPGVSPRPLADAMASLGRALDELAGSDLEPATDSELAAAVAALEPCLRRVEGQQLRLLAAADTRGLPLSSGFGGEWQGLAKWLRSLVPTMGGGQAAGRSREAQLLFTDPISGDLAGTREALLAGTISRGHAQVIASTLSDLQPPAVPEGTVDAETLSETHDLLLEQAHHLGARPLERAAAYLSSRLDPEAGERLARSEEAQARVRTLTVARDSTGMWLVQGLLTPLCGAALSASLDAWSAPRPAEGGAPDERTPAMRRHDAIQQLAERVLTEPGALPTNHGSPYRVTVTVPAATLATRIGAHPGVDLATLPDGWPVSPLTAQTAACSAEILPVLIGPHGDPLDVGNTQYLFPARIRRAIATRDRGCTYPSCSAPPAWCDVHHLQTYRLSGRTSATNGALLCRSHHRAVHRENLGGELVDGHVVWRPPDGGSASPTTTAAVDHATDHLVERWLRRNPHHRR